MYKGTVEYGRKENGREAGGGIEEWEGNIKGHRWKEDWWKWMRVKASRLLRDCHSLLKK